MTQHSTSRQHDNITIKQYNPVLDRPPAKFYKQNKGNVVFERHFYSSLEEFFFFAEPIGGWNWDSEWSASTRLVGHD